MEIRISLTKLHRFSFPLFDGEEAFVFRLTLSSSFREELLCFSSSTEMRQTFSSKEMRCSTFRRKNEIVDEIWRFGNRFQVFTFWVILAVVGS